MAQMGTDEVLTLLQDVAAEVITPRFRKLADHDVSSKRHPGDLVTVADHEAEARGADLQGITSRRSWIGRTLGTLRTLELSWRCCGVDYPAIVDGRADYALFKKTKQWDHAPGSLLVTETGGVVGTFGGQAYDPRGLAPAGLVAAADRATYDLVRRLVPSLPGREGG